MEIEPVGAALLAPIKIEAVLESEETFNKMSFAVALKYQVVFSVKAVGIL